MIWDNEHCQPLNTEINPEHEKNDVIWCHGDMCHSSPPPPLFPVSWSKQEVYAVLSAFNPPHPLAAERSPEESGLSFSSDSFHWLQTGLSARGGFQLPVRRFDRRPPTTRKPITARVCAGRLRALCCCCWEKKYNKKHHCSSALWLLKATLVFIFSVD